MGAVMLFRETSRRQLMFGVGTFAILAHATGAFAARSTANLRGKARPLPLGAVRLKPSDFATAVEVNRTYLHRLDPDRLIHNFRAYAGLEPKAPIYGGGEDDTNQGNTRGPNMTALGSTGQKTRDGQIRDPP